MDNNCFEEFKKLGYTDKEARELAELAMMPSIINPEVDLVDSMDSIIKQLNDIGCTSFNLTAEELKKLGIE